jgi:hypothetical protein
MRSGFGFFGMLLLSACTVNPTAVYYKNGIESAPGVLELKQQPSFRFVERWHISFAWLSGAWGANECHFGHNPFKGKPEYGPLASDNNAPQWHWRNAIVGPHVNDKGPFSGKLQISVSGSPQDPRDVITLGQTSSSGKVDYVNYCSASLSASFTSASATIINAKLYKNAESLLDGAKDVRIGDNQWSVIETPISDYSGKQYGNQPLLERWVLKIPQTDYWMVFTFYASKQFSYIERREAFEISHDLFRKAVASVSLKPIAPLVDQTKIIQPEQCVHLHPISPWICPVNEGSWLK